MSTPPWGSNAPSSPYGAGGTPQPPLGYQPPPPTNGLAIASLVVSVIGFTALCGAPSIIGAILGHVARRQIRERGQSGDGIALAGIIVGWIAFAIFLVIVAVVVVAIIAEESSSTGTTY